MNVIEKLDKKDSILLRDIIIGIRLKDKNFKINKLPESDFYYVRKRMFKVLFHYDALGNTIIDSVRMK
jgi:hypothetical protein